MTMLKRWKRYVSSGLVVKSEQLAVPATFDEVDVLTRGLEKEASRWPYMVREEVERARQLLRRRGIADAQEQAVVPILRFELAALAAAGEALLRVPSHVKLGERYMDVVRSLEKRLGMASVRGWAAKHNAVGLQWVTAPAAEDVAQ